MRWCRIRKARIPADQRTKFERYGTQVIALTLAGGGYSVQGSRGYVSAYYAGPRDLFFINNETATPASVLPAVGHGPEHANAVAWLIEAHDIEERKQTWSLTMEFAITVFVATELLLTVLHKGLNLAKAEISAK